MNEFRVTGYAQEVIFGPGALGGIDQVVEQMGWRRVLLCTSGSQRRSGAVTMLKDLLDERLVASYEQAQAQVPAAQVDEVVELAEVHQVDAVIRLRGRSALGLAKALSFALQERRDAQRAGNVSSLAQAQVPVV